LHLGSKTCRKEKTVAAPNNRKSRKKKFASKRTLNPRLGGGHQPNLGARKAPQQQDPARRLGSFEGRGSHARTGNRGHE
jgi:hypothetical protein